MKKIIGFAGRRFNRLVVIEEAERDKNGMRRWKCKCDCGNEKIVYQNALRSGATQSCGCYCKEVSRNRMSQGWALIFTKDFLIEQHVNQKKSLREIAREAGCSLGCVVRYVDKHHIPINLLQHELTGEKFGKLLVLSQAETYDNSTYWNVRCECGIEKVVKGHSLVRGKTISCGCWNKDKCWRGIGDLSQSYWGRLSSEASKRKLPFDTTIEYAWNLFQKQKGLCALSGVPIKLLKNYSQNFTIKNKAKEKQTASLDRIDSSLSYTNNNIQWVHLTVNRMKSDLPEQEFKNWCKLISDKQNS